MTTIFGNGSSPGALSAGTSDFAYTEMLYRMGFGMLRSSLRIAAEVLIEGTRAIRHGRGYHWAKDREEEIKFSVAFVAGTGLDILCEKFGLEVDPEKFRELFFEECDYQKRLLRSSSSRTTEDD